MSALTLCYALLIGLALPLGLYMGRALDTHRPSALDRLFGPLEAALMRLAGVDRRASMTWSACRSSGPMYSMALSRMNRLLRSYRRSVSSQETM